MPTAIAQATVPANGASNAADFQPETRNPQSAPGELFSQPENVQSGSQEELLQNNRATIQVPNNPAPAGQAQPAANSFNIWPWLIAGFIVGVALVALLRRRRVSVPQPDQPEDLPEMIVPAETVKPKPKTSQPATPKPKKPAPKKSKSQRKKRARR